MSACADELRQVYDCWQGCTCRGQEVSGLKILSLLSTLPLGSSNDLLRAALLLFATVELPSQSDELSNNTTLPSFSNSVLAVGHALQPHARCFLGRRRACWHEIGDVCSQTLPLAQESSIDFHHVQNFAHAIETSFSACCPFRHDV